MSTPRPPGAVRWIARKLEDAGYETWAVGGAVRDALAGLPSGDWDLTTRARPRDVRRVFRRTVPIGVDHGTVGVLARDGTLFEVTTFRRDVQTSGRHAVVAFADELDEDLARRDFTINAVAWHPLKEVVHDPFGGRGDLERGVLRTVGAPEERFAEDYLRVLRALRFAGTFRLGIEPGTWGALVAAVEGLDVLSAERVREELEKLLAGPSPPSRALALYAASGALFRLYPELDRTVGHRRAGGGGEWFSHALRTVDLLPRTRPTLRWAALFQGTGEPEDGGSGHDGGGALRERAFIRTAAVLERLRSSKAHVRDVAGVVMWASRPPDPEASDADLRRWLSGVTRERLGPLLRVWIAVARADRARGGPWPPERLLPLVRRLRVLVRSRVPLSVGELALSGRDLIRMGYRPGPHFGDVLERLLDRVLEDPGRNQPELLAREARRWLDAGELGG